MMGRGKIALAVLVCCIGASALIAEARKHESFSASSYYESNESVTTVEPKDVSETNTATGTNNRYPHGHYPGQTHVWNPVTEKYEAVKGTENAPHDRYPHGHYPGQTHIWNPVTEKYETVNGTKDAPHDRYPHGRYPGQTHIWNPVTQKYETVNATDSNSTGRYPNGYPNTAHPYNAETGKYDEEASKNFTNPSEGRYEHGYWGKASFNYSEGDTLDTIKSSGNYTEEKKSSETGTAEGTRDRYPTGYYGHSGKQTTYHQYTSQPVVDSETFDSVEGRYKHGYHPSSSYARSSEKTKVSSSAQDPTGERYPHGYFPHSRYTRQSMSQPKPVTYTSYTGNFNTLPFPSVGIPFVPNGAGCRTAYWADHTFAWPSFLTVKSTVADAFGEKATEVYGQTTILQALLKYGSDPFSELLRSACTALLNSYTRGEYPISYVKVIEEFDAALVSKEAATKQALLFETANVESISAGNACTRVVQVPDVVFSWPRSSQKLNPSHVCAVV